MQGRVLGGSLLAAVAVVVLAVAAAPAGATFPGANGRIVYEGQGDIYTIKPDGSDLVKLTNSRGNVAPSFSPGGKRIAYSHKVHDHYEIVAMKADGTGKKALTKGGYDFNPAFSPNGKRIVFSRSLQSGGFEYSEIFVMRADGSHLSRVTHTPRFESIEDASPVFSPNGKTIAYQAGGPDETDLILINPDGTHSRPVHTTGFDPSFTLDGSRLLFAETDAQPSQLGIVDLDGGNRHDVTSNTDGGFSFARPRYSPDATKIVVTGYTAPTTAGAPYSSDIYIMNADGTAMTQLTRDGVSRDADWGAATVAAG